MNILLAESVDFCVPALDELKRHGTVHVRDLDRTGLLAAVRDADVLWTRLRNRIDGEVMAAAPRLKVIVTPTTGLNHVDLDEAERRGIRVLSLRGATEFLRNVRATAEHTIGLMLSLLRSLPSAVDHVREGGWDRDCFKGHELHEKTVGVVGYGRLGRIVARYLGVLGARVLVSDPSLDAGSPEEGVASVSLEALLAESDVVTLHVNFTEETRGFFGSSEFRRMKNGAWFVNTARGELIDESALLNSLESSRLSGAALDVLSGESASGMKNHPLVEYSRSHRNLIITPHIGGCTFESMEKTEKYLSRRLVEVLEALNGHEGGPLPQSLV